MKKNKIIFLSDTTSFGSMGVQRYIGPYAVAASLDSAGFDCLVFDYFTQNKNFWEDLENALDENVLAIGISSTFLSPEIEESQTSDNLFMSATFDKYAGGFLQFDSAEKIKNWFAKLKHIVQTKNLQCKIFVGGAKVPYLIEKDSTTFSEVDYFFWGVAAENIKDVFADLRDKGDIQTIQINNHRIVDTKTTYLLHNKCEAFYWDPKWRVQKNEALPIEISRGCIYNCKYCYYDKMKNFRKPVASLKKEFIYNYENYGTTFYHFSDDCFNDSRVKVEETCEMILSLPFKIEWISYARMDVAIKFPHTLDLMIKSGAKGLHWGIESLNHEVAKRAGKGTPTDSVKDFLTTSFEKYQNDCLLLGSFITGLPGETAETQRHTIDWIVNNQALHFIVVSPLRVYPYKPSFDGHAMDFSQYSKFPEKNGFSSVSESGYDWVHSTMNSDEAKILASEFVNRWKESDPQRAGSIKNLWNYPHLRSLGFSEKEIRDFYFNQPSAKETHSLAAKKYQLRLQEYHNQLRTTQ